MSNALSLRLNVRGVTLSWAKGPSLHDVGAVAHYRVEGEAHTLRLAHPDHAATADGLRALWCWEVAEDGGDVWLEVTNVGPAALLLDALDVISTEGQALDLGHPPHRWVFYQNGWGSWSPAFARRLGDSLYTDPGTPDYRRTHQPHWDPARANDLSSEWVTVLHCSSSNCSLLVGFVTMADQLGEIRLASDGVGLVARCHLDGVTLHPGETLHSERLWVRAGPDPVMLLEEWAERAGREMQARVPPTPPTGWCTWYYFYGENTGDDVLENVEAITRHDLPLDVILLDDGYQTAVGDWLSLDAEKFPQGMEPVTAAIRAAGRTPGIWTAPFGAAAGSRLFAEHPHWVLRDEAGEPLVGWTHWGVDCYALDCTHPEVLGWLRETFGRMRAEWGMELFKIDFIFAAARPGRRHDPTATRAQALRRGVEAIREAIGDDAFLLGCGAPLGPCVGLVDGMRVGPDVDPNWHPIWSHDLSMPSTENALRNSLARAPLHGRLWANDPDCLLVRQRGGDMDLVLNELRTLTALVALLGGLTLDSDHLPAIRPGRLKYLRQALPPTGISARPVDLFENEMPRLLLLPIVRDWGCWWIAGVVNWSDRTTETTVHLSSLGLPPGRYHVYHYWRRRYLGVTDDQVTIHRHQPHETAVLLFKPVSEHPDLLTTTFHVCQGAVEVASVKRQASSVEVVLEKAGRQFGEVLFTVPERWRAVEVRVDGVRRSLVSVAPGVVSLGLTLRGQAEVGIHFEEENA
ncbi:MAG: glycoside hydrolase family 36 protein [Anaerolineae bacterium]